MDAACGRRFRLVDHLSPWRQGRKRGRRLAEVGLAAVALALGVGLCELIVRTFFDVPQVGPVFTTYVEDLGLWNKSNLDCVRVAPEYRTRVRTNSLGLRGPEVSPRSPQRRRLLCLGDSFTFGKGVEDSSTYSVLLERHLNASGDASWEVLNSGVVSFGTANEYHYLRTRGIHLEPDHVLLQMCANDVQDNVDSGLFVLDDSGALEPGRDPYARLRRMVRLYGLIPGHDVLDESYLFNFVRLRLNLAVLSPGPAPVVGGPKATDAREPWELELALLRGVAGVCRQHHIPFTVLLFDLDPHLARAVEGLAREEGGEVVDLGALEVQHPELYYPKDRHWTPEGHQYVAARLATALALTGSPAHAALDPE
jgi:hypothetical protein